MVSYGTINGLSGDHSDNVYSLEKLLLQNSYLQAVITLHNKYIANGYSAAPDKQLIKLDKKYAFLALKNIAHFYNYDKGWERHFNDFDTSYIKNAVAITTATNTFKQLNKTNALLMYATLHSSALYLAEQAAISALENNTLKAKELLYYAYLFNAYADHFLQDAFSSGHLLVNRTILRSVVNNKSLHTFIANKERKLLMQKVKFGMPMVIISLTKMGL
jgi:hypothetical protein